MFDKEDAMLLVAVKLLLQISTYICSINQKVQESNEKSNTMNSARQSDTIKVTPASLTAPT